MKIVRILTYESNDKNGINWIKQTLHYSSPDGQFINLKIETVEYPEDFTPSEYGLKRIDSIERPKLEAK